MTIERDPVDLIDESAIPPTGNGAGVARPPVRSPEGAAEPATGLDD